MWPSADDVFLPNLAKTILIEPRLKFCAFMLLEFRLFVFTIDQQLMLFWVEIVCNDSELSGDKEPGVIRSFLEQGRNDVKSVWMKPQFRLVNNDVIR